MNRNEIFRSVLDGMILVFLWYFLAMYSISVYVTLDDPFSLGLGVVVICICIILATVSAFYNLDFKKIKGLLCRCAISCICTIFFYVLVISINQVININLIAKRELSNADGIVIMYFCGSFLAVNFVIRGILLLVSFMGGLLKKAPAHKTQCGKAEI